MTELDDTRLDAPLPPGLTDHYADLLAALANAAGGIMQDLTRLHDAYPFPGLGAVLGQASVLAYALDGLVDAVDGALDAADEGICPGCGERHPPVKHDG